MRGFWSVWLLALLISVPAAGTAQTRREAAVALERMAVRTVNALELDVVASPLRLPWSLAFLPDGGMLVTEKYHGLRLVRSDGSLSQIFPGGPTNVFSKEDAGYLDVVLDPDFATNHAVYIAFSEGNEEANRPAVWKARLDGERLTGGKVIFRANFTKKAPSHPGGRLLFLPDKTFLFTVGDGFDYKEAAQNMRSHFGKVLRLTREGAAASDNPFAGKADIAPEIWSSGHRNIQGLALDPATNLVWAHEHGPRGGDELNQLKAGANYGWPLVSHGIDYDGTVITERAIDPRFERSHFYWAPSIAPSGLAIYRGDRYPAWKDRLFVGGMAARTLIRLRIRPTTGLLVEDERMLTAFDKRIRDVRVGPDGLIYLLTDYEDGQVLRLVPPGPPVTTPK